MGSRAVSGRTEGFYSVFSTYDKAVSSPTNPKKRKHLTEQVSKSLSLNSRDTNGVRFLPRLSSPNKRVFAMMKKVGSLYEEMAKQLVASGEWERVLVSKQHGMSQLVISETGEPMDTGRFSLVLGEKIPIERLIASRRIRLDLGNKFAGPSCEKSTECLVVNYLEKLRCITLKGSMVSTLLEYYGNSWDILGKYLPMTFRLLPRQPIKDERQFFFSVLYRKSMLGTYWIAKCSSGCHGDNIKIFRNSRLSIKKMIKFIDDQHDPHMWVVQLYVDRPLLYNQRKFDVRCWVLLRGENYDIYVHEQLVMRMSTVEYTRKNITTNTSAGRFAHITNHCVQEASEACSHFEEGNELWMDHLDSVVRYRGCHLRQSGIGHKGANRDLEPSLKNTILPQMYHIIVDTMLSARGVVPYSPPSTPCFQVFGYDFLIDDMLRVWLLEINGSPGVSAKLLQHIVTDTIEITLKPYFPDSLKRLARDRENDGVRCNGYVKLFP